MTITGVSFVKNRVSSVSGIAVTAIDEIVIRIPAKSDVGGAEYVDDSEFRRNRAGKWTLREGDFVCKGLVADNEPPTDANKITSFADNRDNITDHLKHWRVTCK